MNASAELRPTFKKYYTLTPHLQISFCLVYFGEKQVSAACKQLDRTPDLPENMIYLPPSSAPEGTTLCRAIKIYQPAAGVEGETPMVVFTPLQVGEDYCEVTLQRLTRGSQKPLIACFREREFVRDDETGEVKENGPGLFGFNLSHPWHPRRHHFPPQPDYLCLIEERPGGDWPCFEPVWMKVRGVNDASFKYFRLSLTWDESGNVVGVMLAEFDTASEEIPEELKKFNDFPRP